MANGYSGLDFPNVHSEIAYWLSHTTSFFKGGYSGSGENGNDFSMPVGTPVYAVAGGKVKGSGYYACGGGVVSIEESPNRVWYYQHLDLDEAGVGQNVKAGQLIGYSGGQNSGGHHPAGACSSYPHIEVGINAPWGGIWGGGPSVGPNIDPRPFLTAILNGKPLPTSGGGSTAFVGSVSSKGGGGSGGSSGGSSSNKTAVNCTFPTNPLDTAQWGAYITCLGNQAGSINIATAIQAGIAAAVTGIFGAVPWDRVVKVVLGVFLLFSGFIVLILPDAADIALSAVGAPELGEAARQNLAHPLRSGTTGNTISAVRRAYKGRVVEKQQSARAYTNYQVAARRYREKQQRQQVREYQLQLQRQQAPQAPQRALATKPVKTPTGALPVLPTPKLGATKNPMSAEDIARIPRSRRREGIENFIKQNQALIDMKHGTPADQEQYQKNVQKGNEALSRMPPVQRGPKTQLRLVNPLTEIPRLARQIRQNSTRRAQRGVDRQLTIGDITKQPPTKKAQREKESNASRQAFLQGKSASQGSVDDILKDLRGE